MLTVLDYSAGVPPAAAIRAAGHDGVIRYISPPRAGWMLGKPIQKTELGDLMAWRSLSYGSSEKKMIPM